eukprot:jgi/Chrzof1/6059/Cz17g07070.t1
MRACGTKLQWASAAAVAVFLLVVPHVCAQDTTGKQLSGAQGFTFQSDVSGYLKLSEDICEIKAALQASPPDYAGAQDIYENGKNSIKRDGSIRTLRGIARGNYEGEPYWDLYTTYFKSPTFLDDFIMAGFNGTAPYKSEAQREQTIAKGIESNLQFIYVMHELDEATEKVEEKNIDKDDGAPNNIDETWAIYVGERPACSMWGASNKRGRDFGTMADCEKSRVNAAMLTTHQNGYKAAVAGNLKDMQATRTRAEQLMVTTYVQATLKYAQEVDSELAAGESGELAQAEGYAFFRTIEPLVARANAQSAAAIKRVLQPGNPIVPTTYATVSAALQAAYPKLGITAANIGTFGAKQELGCVNTTAPAGAATEAATPAAAITSASPQSSTPAAAAATPARSAGSGVRAAAWSMAAAAAAVTGILLV